MLSEQHHNVDVPDLPLLLLTGHIGQISTGHQTEAESGSAAAPAERALRAGKPPSRSQALAVTWGGSAATGLQHEHAPGAATRLGERTYALHAELAQSAATCVRGSLLNRPSAVNAAKRWLPGRHKAA
jgi:hypothetical protein